jgi:hypothetical protein
VDDSASTPAGIPVTVPVLANDSDLDGDTLTVVEVTTPANGTAVINTDGTITYTPNAGFTGTDTFTYTVTDGTDTATASITINVGALPALVRTGLESLDLLAAALLLIAAGWALRVAADRRIQQRLGSSGSEAD